MSRIKDAQEEIDKIYSLLDEMVANGTIAVNAQAEFERKCSKVKTDFLLSKTRVSYGAYFRKNILTR